MGLILLLILIPILGIAWARNSKAQKIRKQRKKEREERIRIEKSIDSKPVSEIEAELRAEIEKDRLERQQAVEEAQRNACGRRTGVPGGRPEVGGNEL